MSDTTTLSEQEIAELRALEEKATPAPWGANDGRYASVYKESDAYGPNIKAWHIQVDVGENLAASRDVAAFIAAARNALPRLLDALAAERSAREALRSALQLAHDRLDAVNANGDFSGLCFYCRATEYDGVVGIVHIPGCVMPTIRQVLAAAAAPQAQGQAAGEG